MSQNEEPKRGLTRRILDKASAAVRFVKGVTFDALASFTSEGKQIDFPIDFETDTVLASQAQMAELFGVTKSTIREHLRTLFATGELIEDAVTRESGVVASDTNPYAAKLYDLDAIIAVGYRVNSRKATEFRKWATTVLKGYIEKGYALNGKRLDSDPSALLALAREVRAIRTSEKNLYTQVRETFAECAIDYDKDDPAARTFFYTSQDVFHFAASGQTALEIIQSRADANKPNMGLTALGNRRPTVGHVTTAKNYCSPEELRKMELIGEAWLLYAEGMAMQGKQVSMQRLLEKLRDLVTQYEFPVFPGYQRSRLDKKAVHDHAKMQLSLFRKSPQIEHR